MGPSIVIGLLFIGYLSRLTDVFLVEWLILGLVALTLHEMGHALAFGRYGVSSAISFWGLGGLTSPTDLDAAERLTDRQMVVVALAGPGVSLVVGALSLAPVIVARQFVELQSNSIRVPVSIWLFVNLAWGLFNLLPIASLDGGRALSHLIGAIFPGRLGLFLGASANLAASVIVAVGAFWIGQPYIAFIAILFGLASPDLYARLWEGIRPARTRPEQPRPEQPRPEQPRPDLRPGQPPPDRYDDLARAERLRAHDPAGPGDPPEPMLRSNSPWRRP